MYNKQFAKKYDALGWEIFSKDLYKKIQKLQIEGKDVLDVACGTGTLANLFEKDGYNVTAFDKSSEMIKVAKEKNMRVNFFVEDMLEFNLNQKFDLIVCAYDSINHIKNWERFFKKVHKHLKNDGVFIFDFNTIKGLRKWRNSFENKHKDGKIIISGNYNTKERKASLNIKNFNLGQNETLDFEDDFISYAHPVLEVKNWLKKTGFSFKRFDKKDKNPSRIFFVCKKKKV